MIVFFILTFCFPFFLFCQSYVGLWKGCYYPNGTTPDRGKLIYLEITKELEGKIRNEQYDTEDFAIKQIKITANKTNNDALLINETIITKKASGSKTNWCRLQVNLKYNVQTGYLEGSYSSNECKNFIGKIILYQYEGTFPSETKNPESHFWFEQLCKDLRKGLKAPIIRKQERDNFKFQPIYFDYDKAEIKTEFFPFLDEVIHVLEGHSDLRIKIVGHTDSDGSDEYNDGLSQRRAKAIIEYFVSKGVEEDRLEIDFYGEKKPVDTNKTPEGRQNNRRVDFLFI